MKTLEDVIKAFECCQDVGCNDCPYKILFNDDTHVPCDQFEKDDDALQWLKGYRGHIELDKIRDKCEAENEPLSWDELKQMEGKPVWLEDSNQQGEWVLLSGMEDDVLYFVYRTCNEYKIYRKEQGTLWKAYRKERS